MPEVPAIILQWFLYTTAALGAALIVAGLVWLLYNVWAYLFMTGLQMLKIQTAFFQFVQEKYNKRPKGNK